jgi:copper chaperone CopZ
MKYLVLLVSLTLAPLTHAFAEESAAPANRQVLVNVNGMVCDFCAQGLKKLFGEKEEVENIEVDLDAKIVTLELKEGQNLSDELISKIIQDNGLSVEGINRKE